MKEQNNDKSISFVRITLMGPILAILSEKAIEYAHAMFQFASTCITTAKNQ